MKHIHVGFKRRLMLPLLGIALCITVSTLFSSCAKDGATGTANVIYSDWFTPSTYVKDTVFGVWGFSYNKAAPEITAQMLDSSSVLVFGKLNGYNPVIWPTGQVSQLPITIIYLSGSTPYEDVWSALATVGNLKIRLIDDHNAYGSISNAHQFRYIIIPGGIAAARPAVGTTAPPNYAAMSYQQLCAKLNIPQ